MAVDTFYAAAAKLSSGRQQKYECFSLQLHQLVDSRSSSIIGCLFQQRDSSIAGSIALHSIADSQQSTLLGPDVFNKVRNTFCYFFTYLFIYFIAFLTVQTVKLEVSFSYPYTSTAYLSPPVANFLIILRRVGI